MLGAARILESERGRSFEAQPKRLSRRGKSASEQRDCNAAIPSEPQFTPSIIVKGSVEHSHVGSCKQLSSFGEEAGKQRGSNAESDTLSEPATTGQQLPGLQVRG
jgi:hypothetical protein